ncbi:hypothetical protein KJ636_05435 [Patescibacteria group bacterium]|nr:hypothetical protein [Patescibacteria group bacterium]MBU4481822.1 hypothetical protein [Patescibacteria group bacterium]
MAVLVLVSVGAALGVAGYLVTRPKPIQQPMPNIPVIVLKRRLYQITKTK